MEDFPSRSSIRKHIAFTSNPSPHPPRSISIKLRTAEFLIPTRLLETPADWMATFGCPLIPSNTCRHTYWFPTSPLSPSEETDISKPFLTWLDVMVSSCPATPLCLSCWSTTELRLVQITRLTAVKTFPARLLSSVSVPWDWKLHPESAIHPCSLIFGQDEHCIVFPPWIWNYRPTECYHMVSNETANYINRLLLHQSNVFKQYRNCKLHKPFFNS